MSINRTQGFSFLDVMVSLLHRPNVQKILFICAVLVHKVTIFNESLEWAILQMHRIPQTSLVNNVGSTRLEETVWSQLGII